MQEGKFALDQGGHLTTWRRVSSWYLPPGPARLLRVNSRWLKNCRDKPQDYYPVIIIEGGEATYWNYAEFMDCSATVVSSLGERTVRMGTTGAVICR